MVDRSIVTGDFVFPSVDVEDGDADEDYEDHQNYIFLDLFFQFSSNFHFKRDIDVLDLLIRSFLFLYGFLGFRIWIQGLKAYDFFQVRCFLELLVRKMSSMKVWIQSESFSTCETQNNAVKR